MSDPRLITVYVAGFGTIRGTYNSLTHELDSDGTKRLTVEMRVLAFESEVKQGKKVKAPRKEGRRIRLRKPPPAD